MTLASLPAFVVALMASVAHGQTGSLYSCDSHAATISLSNGQTIDPSRSFGVGVTSGYGSQSASSFVATGLQAAFAAPQPSGDSTINVTMTGTTFSPAPSHLDTCGYITLGPLPPGGYRINLLLDYQPGMPPVKVTDTYVGIAPTGPYQDEKFGPPEVMISPPILSPSTPIQVSVPVISCYFGDPNVVVDSSSVEVTGQVVAVTVEQMAQGCFSAGDPLVPKPITFTVPPLPVGEYTLRYRRLLDQTSFILDAEDVSFIVAIDPAVAATVPTLSRSAILSLLLLLLIGGLVARVVRRPL